MVKHYIGGSTRWISNNGIDNSLVTKSGIIEKHIPADNETGSA